MFMSSVTYREFRDASREKSVDLYRHFFKYMYQRNSSINIPIGILMYCTDDDVAAYMMGPVPRTMQQLHALRDTLFELKKDKRIKFINFTTMSVIDDDEPTPSLVSLVCDREIWDVSYAPLDFNYATNRSSEDGQDHLFGIVSENDLSQFDIAEGWQALGETGESHSEVAEAFMKKMR